MMETFVQSIAEYLSVTPQTVVIILVGAAVLAGSLGLSLALASVLSLVRRRGQSDDGAQRSSRLLPTLAREALSTELRPPYTESIYLDARLDDVAPEVTSRTGSKLGRAIRRSLVELQTRRFDDPDADGSDDLERIERVLDEAISRVDAIDADSHGTHDLESYFEELETRLP